MPGIQSLMPQGPVPGQAPQHPMQGMMPKPGASTPPAQVKFLETKPSQELRAMYDQQPSLALLTAYTKAVEREKLNASMRGQQAVQQAAGAPATIADSIMQQPVMAAHGGLMHSYAGGGAVSFENGGRTFGFAPDYELARKYGIDLSPYDSPSVREEKIKRARAMAGFDEQRKSFGEIPTEASVAREQGIQQAYASPSRVEDVPQKIVPMAMRDTRGATPETVAAARQLGIGQVARQRTQPQATVPVGIASPVEATGSPRPDALSSIEAEGIAGIKSLQDIIRQQGNVDPRLAELREAAYKSSQDIAARRERDRQAALEAAQSQYGDISDLIIGAAGGAKGKTFGEVLSGAVGGAGAVRTAKRAEFQKAQELSNQQQKANEDLLQALAEKRVTDETGNVAQRRQADMKVAEAQLKVTELRSGIQKERALEADRGEQRQISREQIQSQERIAAANRAATAELRNLPGPEQQMIERAIKSLQDANPGMAYHEAYDKVRGAGKGLEERAEAARAKNATARQKLLNENMTYFSAQNTYISATDPAKKAEALRKMKEIERLNGIIDETAAPATGAANDPLGLRK